LEYTSMYTYKYNTNGKKIEAIIYSGVDSGIVYKYDRNGRIYELIRNTKYEPGEKSEFKYNAAGDIIEAKEFNSKIISYLTIYKYDQRHLLTEKIGFKGNKFGDKPSYFVKVTYRYKSFDAKGNWTKVMEHFWGTEDSVTRKITYY
jgi:hypothetical protein